MRLMNVASSNGEPNVSLEWEHLLMWCSMGLDLRNSGKKLLTKFNYICFAKECAYMFLCRFGIQINFFARLFLHITMSHEPSAIGQLLAARAKCNPRALWSL